MGLDVILAILVPALLLSAFTIGLVARSEAQQQRRPLQLDLPLSWDRPDGPSAAHRQRR